MWIPSSAARNHLLFGCCSLVSQKDGHGYYWNYIHFLGLHLDDLLPVSSSLEEFRLQNPREVNRTMCPGCQWSDWLVTTNEITDQCQGHILLPFWHEQVWHSPSVDQDTYDTWQTVWKEFSLRKSGMATGWLPVFPGSVIFFHEEISLPTLLDSTVSVREIVSESRELKLEVK